MIRVGNRLREERLKRGLTLEEVAKATKIRTNFLASIEKGEYNKLPSSAYATGFVKNYADFLGLSKRETLALFRREFDEEKTFQVLPEGLPDTAEFLATRFKLSEKILYIAVVFLGLLVYMAFQYRAVVINPPLTIYSPKEKEVVNSLDVRISGKTDPNVTVTVNNAIVSIDNNGKFEKTISVFAGDQTVTIEAVNRFGRKTREARRITIKPPS